VCNLVEHWRSLDMTAAVKIDEAALFSVFRPNGVV